MTIVIIWPASHALAADTAPLPNTTIASKAYVDMVGDTKLSADATAVQDMAGEYTVTGTLKVPTQPLPTAD